MLNFPGPALQAPPGLQRDAEHFSKPRDDIRALIPTNRLKLPRLRSNPDLRKPPLLFATHMTGNGGRHSTEPHAAVAYRRMLQEMTSESNAEGASSVPPPCLEAPPPPQGRRHKATEEHLAAAGHRHMRLIHSLQDAGTHSPATFVAEIVNFVETQLAELERQFPAEDSVMPHMPNTTLLPSEVAMRRIGAAAMTTEENRRKLRLHVFLRAQRMFAESFKTYQQFLEALADENASYVQFLMDDLVLHKEVLLGQREEMRQVKEEASLQVQCAARERDAAVAALHDERERHRKQRAQQQEQAQKEKAHETDARRQLFELEHQLHMSQEDLKASRRDADSLRSENSRLTIQTFSDQLQALGHQVQDWKQQCAHKEDVLHEAHDESAELMKDLRRVVEHFNAMLEYEQQLHPEHVRLSVLGFRALFPEAAKKKKKKGVTSPERGGAPLSPSNDAALVAPSTPLRVEATLQEFLPT